MRQMRETDGRTEEIKALRGVSLFFFAISPSQRLERFAKLSLIHYPVQYIHGQHCTLQAEACPSLSRNQCVIFFLSLYF